MLLDTETEVSGLTKRSARVKDRQRQEGRQISESLNAQARRGTHLREVALPELVLLDLKTALKDLLRLRAADGDVASDLLVPADTEVADGVPGLGGDRGLSGELLENLRGTSEPVTRLSDGDV